MGTSVGIFYADANVSRFGAGPPRSHLVALEPDTRFPMCRVVGRECRLLHEKQIASKVLFLYLFFRSTVQKE